MNKKEIKSEFVEYDSVTELGSAEQNLILEAERAAKNAYAPYSEFKVGAAVLFEDGKIICGSNQENASYSSGLCAERVALFAASAQNPSVKITHIAVTSSSQNPAAPCGACRQVISEYEMLHNHPVSILLKSSSSGKIISARGIKNFLPLMFTRKDLEK
ncbi:MAG TPA: cytidine deaminase [Bacteroidia bacterium]|nr:cytidine deaminase [Bacteroidia bacterium]